MTKGLYRLRAVAFAVVGCLATLPAQAGMLVGTSDTLTSQQQVDQLETWLGQGPVTITNIFDYKATPGTPFDLATAFHNAVDGKGPTFTLFRLGDTYDYYTGTLTKDTNQIVGGYDPQSWNSSFNYSYTSNDADRTAFLFNLTGTQSADWEKQSQKFNADPSGYGYVGAYQTYNGAFYGPAFGPGFDLYAEGRQQSYVAYGLSSYDGYAAAYGYGPGVYFNGPSVPGNILKGDTGLTYFAIKDIEVFSISPSAITTPEPTSIAMLCFGGLGFGLLAKRRRQVA